MKPYYQDNSGITLYHADCLAMLQSLPTESAQCCVTSPPYWGLRDYGTAGQLGLESTPEQYVAGMVAVFAEVRRVLKVDGVCWLNLGDSYAAGRGGTTMPAETLAGGVGGFGDESSHRGRLAQVPDGKNPNAPISTYQPHRNAGAIGLKHKDMVGIPWRVAFALQADGWWLRQDIIWSKPNPMPESVTDRCTKAHEYIFLLSKSARYFYDAAAVAEPLAVASVERLSQPTLDRQAGSSRVPGKTNGTMKAVAHPRYAAGAAGIADRKNSALYETRNRRSVWEVTTKPFREAHFATFPPEIPQTCILAGSRTGDTVLDPFNGAGTTGLVAQEFGRKYIGCDLNKDYLDMTIRRLAQGVLGLEFAE